MHRTRMCAVNHTRNFNPGEKFRSQTNGHVVVAYTLVIFRDAIFVGEHTYRMGIRVKNNRDTQSLLSRQDRRLHES
jgi:hypothetical protein